MFDDYSEPEFTNCMHRHIQVNTKGKMYFSGGDIYDNLQDQIICLDCMRTLTEREVRERWTGRDNSILAGK